MIKTFLPIFALATLALPSGLLAQSKASTSSTTGTASGVFGGPLAEHQPTPKATAAPTDAGGKKQVGELALTTDEKGKSSLTNFPAGTTTIYLQARNTSGAAGDKVTVEWFADDTGKAIPKGKRFYSSAVPLPNTSTYNPNFHATGPIKGVFPPGKYHVDVSIGKEKLKSARFTVM